MSHRKYTLNNATLRELIDEAINAIRNSHGFKHNISTPNMCRRYLTLINYGEDKEVFRVLFLDTQNGLIAEEVMFTGTIDQCGIYPREIVRRALHLNATKIIIAHNHPSGHCLPSDADKAITKKIKEACTTVGEHLIDHFIVGIDTYSFAEKG